MRIVRRFEEYLVSSYEKCYSKNTSDKAPDYSYQRLKGYKLKLMKTFESQSHFLNSLEKLAPVHHLASYIH